MFFQAFHVLKGYLWVARCKYITEIEQICCLDYIHSLSFIVCYAHKNTTTTNTNIRFDMRMF